MLKTLEQQVSKPEQNSPKHCYLDVAMTTPSHHLFYLFNFYPAFWVRQTRLKVIYKKYKTTHLKLRIYINITPIK